MHTLRMAIEQRHVALYEQAMEFPADLTYDHLQTASMIVSASFVSPSRSTQISA